MARFGRKKEQFGDFLRHVDRIDPDAAGDSEFFQMLEESRELDELARGFRHHALQTQLRQDHHLSWFSDKLGSWFGNRLGNSVDDKIES